MSGSRTGYDLAVGLSRQGRSKQALKAARAALSTDPGDPRVASITVSLELSTKVIDVDTAIDRLRELSVKHPSTPEVLGDLAGALFYRGDRSEAIELTERYLGTFGENAGLWRRLGWMQLTEDPANAWTSYRRSIEIEPIPAYQQRLAACAAARKADDVEGMRRLIFEEVHPFERLRLRMARLMTGRLVIALLAISFVTVFTGATLAWPVALLGIVMGLLPLAIIPRGTRRPMVGALVVTWGCALALPTAMNPTASPVWWLSLTAIAIAGIGFELAKKQRSTRAGGSPLIPGFGPSPARVVVAAGSFAMFFLVYAPWYRVCLLDSLCVQAGGISETLRTSLILIVLGSVIWSIIRLFESKPRFTYWLGATVSFVLAGAVVTLSGIWLIGPDKALQQGGNSFGLISSVQRTPWAWLGAAVAGCVFAASVIDLIEARRSTRQASNGSAGENAEEIGGR